jgi:hypothetical protein
MGYRLNLQLRDNCGITAGDCGAVVIPRSPPLKGEQLRGENNVGATAGITAA